MPKKPEKMTDAEINKIPAHIAMDERKRNDNIDKGHVLCGTCDGTGNEFYSMYHACKTCKGTGILPPELQELKKEFEDGTT